MTEPPTWHGTPAEAQALEAALQGNCACTLAPDGRRLTTCAPHAMLLGDQRALDGLLAMRHIATRLEAEEFTPAEPGEEPCAP